MIENIEYLSARTLHQTNVPDKYLQGTGTIIASQGNFFLGTALHCMRQTDEEGNETVSPDWKKMKATIYLKDREVDLGFKRIVDVDDNSDVVISSLGFINVKNKCTLLVSEKYSKLISVRKSLFR